MKYAWLLTIALLASCAQQVQDPVREGSAAIERFDTDEGELVYLRDAEGVTFIETAAGFSHIELHTTLQGGEVRALTADGAIVIDWTDVADLQDMREPESFEGELELPETAHVLEFRASNESLEFGRFLLSDHGSHHEGEVILPEGAFLPFAAIPGRWIPPADILAIANTMYLPYSGAPSSCSGTFRPGTRKIADFLRAEFEGATSYGGYACRANTANTSQLSVHASGRAIDLFVPLDGGEADNDLGDPIAHYLITHAEELGVEFIVWDRTSWGAHREAPKHRAYTGPHPHHDHLHIEIAPSVANNTNPTIPPPDKSPVGYLDAADCDGIRGWAQDPDDPDAPVRVYISIGGPVFTEGAHGYWLTADDRREDLCTAIGSCDHGYTLPTPYGLMDGQAREVYVYGEDITGGRNSELTNSGRVLQCDPPEPTLAPTYGVLRHVTNPESLAAWGFDTNAIVSVDDTLLDTYEIGAPLPQVPDLQRTGAPVYVVEGFERRHITSGASLEAWGFDRGAIVDTDTETLLTSEPMEFRPFLMRGSGPAVYLLTAPPALVADSFAWDAPARVGVGQTATAVLQFRNRGAITWQPEEFAVVDLEPELVGPVEHGQTTTLTFDVTAPSQPGTTDLCPEFAYLGYPFGQSPPCLQIEVVEEQLDPEDLGPTGNPTPVGNGNDSPGTSVNGQGSCSSAAASPAWLLLLAVGFIRRRRSGKQ